MANLQLSRNRHHGDIKRHTVYYLSNGTADSGTFDRRRHGHTVVLYFVAYGLDAVAHTFGIGIYKIPVLNGGAGLVTDVINVVPGKTFSLRVNALAISADRAAMFYGVVLTDIVDRDCNAVVLRNRHHGDIKRHTVYYGIHIARGIEQIR